MASEPFSSEPAPAAGLPAPVMYWAPNDVEALRLSVRRLERPDFPSRLAQAVGLPIERAYAALPERWAGLVTRSTRIALARALEGALLGLPTRSGPLSRQLHRALAGTSGALGGAFGPLGLALELPLSAAIMLRSVAAVAQGQGEDPRDPATKLACLEVLAFGTGIKPEQHTDTGYYAIRALLAKSIADSARHLATRGTSLGSAPAVIRLLAMIATRLSIPFSQKFALQTVPVFGAAGGASINLLFLEHYRSMAQAHFTIRRLERSYGAAAVREGYEAFAGPLRPRGIPR